MKYFQSLSPKEKKKQNLNTFTVLRRRYPYGTSVNYRCGWGTLYIVDYIIQLHNAFDIIIIIFGFLKKKNTYSNEKTDGKSDRRKWFAQYLFILGWKNNLRLVAKHLYRVRAAYTLYNMYYIYLYYIYIKRSSSCRFQFAIIILPRSSTVISCAPANACLVPFDVNDISSLVGTNSARLVQTAVPNEQWVGGGRVKVLRFSDGNISKAFFPSWVSHRTPQRYYYNNITLAF